MPRKRRVPKLAHRQLRWDDVDMSMLLNFWTAWRPPQGEFERGRSHWQTWEQYLGDWALVRAAALPEYAAKQTELLALYRAEVARRRSQLREATTDSDRELYGRLLADAVERVEDREDRELPFAERVYRRLLAGEEV